MTLAPWGPPERPTQLNSGKQGPLRQSAQKGSVASIVLRVGPHG